MPTLRFDLAAAKAANYTDAEIAEVLAKQSGFDLASARAAGYKDGEIVTRLAGGPSMVDPVPQKSDAQKVAESTGVGEAMLVGAGRTFDRIGKGMQQGFYSLTGNEEELAKLKQAAAEDDAVYEPLKKAHPIATAVGESAPSMVVPVGATATAVGTAAKLAASGAIPAALEYGTIGERAKNAAGSAAGAVIGGQVIPKVASTVVHAGKSALRGLAGNITPEALALAEKAKAFGIPVNVAQLSDSKFLKTLASSLEQMPFTGGAKAAADQRTAFTKAVGKTFGADVDKITPEVYNSQRTRLGEQFDQLASRNELNVTPELKAKLGTIMEGAEGTASDDTIRAVRNIIGRVGEQSSSTGGRVPAQMSSLVDEAGAPIVRQAASETPVSTKIDGTTYSSIDSELSNIIKAGGEKGLYAKRLQSALREGMDASISPADRAAWNETRTQYKNLKAVRNTVAKDGGNGDIPPTQLMHALNSTEASKEAMAMGSRGTLGELGQIGRQFVRDTVPNSGTAQRAIAMGLIGGGGYAFGAEPTTILGMAAGGATAGRLINKALTSPRVIEALGRQGITLTDLLNMPPDRITQIIGGLTGMTTENMGN